MERFRACFGDLDDPRTGNAQRHDLLEILLIALAATLSGAETSVDMALFGQAKEPVLRGWLRLEGGIPSHDTFSRLFRLLDPDAFEASFRRFVAAFAEQVGCRAGRGRRGRQPPDCGRRRQDCQAQLRPAGGPSAAPHGQRLGGGAAPGVGPAEGRRRQQRDHGRARLAAGLGNGAPTPFRRPSWRSWLSKAGS